MIRAIQAWFGPEHTTRTVLSIGAVAAVVIFGAVWIILSAIAKVDQEEDEERNHLSW